VRPCLSASNPQLIPLHHFLYQNSQEDRCIHAGDDSLLDDDLASEYPLGKVMPPLKVPQTLSGPGLGLATILERNFNSFLRRKKGGEL
jgi:hypothetical protein